MEWKKKKTVNPEYYTERKWLSKMRQNKNYFSKQKLREFTANRSEQPEMWKEVL